MSVFCKDCRHLTRTRYTWGRSTWVMPGDTCDTMRETRIDPIDGPQQHRVSAKERNARFDCHLFEALPPPPPPPPWWAFWRDE